MLFACFYEKLDTCFIDRISFLAESKVILLPTIGRAMRDNVINDGLPKNPQSRIESYHRKHSRLWWAHVLPLALMILDSTAT